MKTNQSKIEKLIDKFCSNGVEKDFLETIKTVEGKVGKKVKGKSSKSKK